jgi:uncharacterized caspase-like protein
MSARVVPALLGLLVLCPGLVPGSLGAQAPAKARQPTLHGVLVGVNDYSKVKGYALANTRCSVPDARAMHKLLAAQKGKAYGDVQLSLLLDESASREAILKRLADIARKAQPNDWAVVYLAGQGFAKMVKADVYEPGSFFFVCPNTDRKDLAKTALTSRDLFESLARMRCRVLLLVDACHSGDLAANPVRNLNRNAPRVFILAGCKVDQSTFEPKKGKNALFTQCLVEALGERFKTADGNGDGSLDLSELQSYVAKRLSELLKRYRLEAGDQVPVALPARFPRLPIAR